MTSLLPTVAGRQEALIRLYQSDRKDRFKLGLSSKVLSELVRYLTYRGTGSYLVGIRRGAPLRIGAHQI